MARSIRKSTDPSTKYFLAFLKQEYDLVQLNAIHVQNSTDIDETIKKIGTDFDQNFTAKVQKIFTKYKSVLDLKNELPPHREKIDHEINLVPDAKVPPAKVYRMSIPELEELRKQLDAYLSKGWIRPSMSNFAAPILFQRKADGSLRLCVDY